MFTVGLPLGRIATVCIPLVKNFALAGNLSSAKFYFPNLKSYFNCSSVSLKKTFHSSCVDFENPPKMNAAKKSGKKLQMLERDDKMIWIDCEVIK